MTYLRMVLSGTLMICVICLVRLILKNILPKRTFLVLWGIAMLRLTLPYSLPCMFSVSAMLENRILAGNVAEIADRAYYTGYEGYADAGGYMSGAVRRIAGFIGKVIHMNAPIVIIWLAGATLLAIFFTVVYIRARRIFRESLPFENDFAKNLLLGQNFERKVEIRQSDRIKAPLTYGILRPVILLPKEKQPMNAKDLRYILAHELAHIKYFDALLKLLLATVLCAHWINPAVWVMYFAANRDIELACDESVVKSIGIDLKEAYAGTLIRMEEAKLFSLCWCGFCVNNTRERICSIMKIKKTTTAAVVVSVILVTAIGLFFATSESAKAAEAGEYGYDESVSVVLSEDDAADIMEVLIKSYDEYDAVEGERIERGAYYNNYEVNYRNGAGDTATGTVSEYSVYVGDSGKAQVLYIFTDADGNVSESLPDELL